MSDSYSLEDINKLVSGGGQPAADDGVSLGYVNALIQGKDLAKGLAVAPIKAGIGMAGLPVDAVNLAGRSAHYLAGKAKGLVTGDYAMEPYGDIPGGSADIRKGIESFTGPIYEPRSAVARYPAKALEYGLGAMATRGASSAIGMGLAGATGGILGEAATDATKGQGGYLEQFAGPVATVLGTGIPAAAVAARGTAGSMLRDRLGGVTPEDFTAGTAMQAQGRQVGVPLMGSESIDSRSLQQLTADVAASRTGGPIIDRFTAQRPEQVRQVYEDMAGQVAPRPATTEATSMKVQGAAEQAIDDAMGQRSAAVKPFYDAARDVPIPLASRQYVADMLDESAKGVSADTRAVLDRLKEKVLTEERAGPLDSLYKKQRDANALVPGTAAEVAEKEAAATSGKAMGALGRELEAESPTLAAGRAKYQQMTRDVVEPLVESPVGYLGRRAGTPTENSGIANQIGWISDPKKARPASISETANVLNGVDNTAFPDLARTYLDNNFSTAAKQLQSGENRAAGAKFYGLLAGEPQERANFKAIMGGVARARGVPEGEFVDGAERILRVLDRTGRVPGIGSPTASRAAAGEEAAKGLGTSLLNASITKPASPLRDVLRDYYQAGNFKKLGQVLTAPDSVEQIRRLSQLERYSPKEQAAVITILGLNRSLERDSGGDSE